MDYMREISAFYDWAETNQVSPSGILLWHALMFLANKARWPKRLAVPISVLEVRTKLKRTAIFKARGKLKQCGLISFESRDGNQSAVYTINPFCVRLTDAVADASADATADATADTNPDAVADHNTSYPSDTRKTKTKTKTSARDYGNVVDPFGFGPDTSDDVLTDAVRQIQDAMLADDWPERDKRDIDAAEDCVRVYSLPWVLEAMSRVQDDRERRNWRYVRGILRSWSKAGGMDTPAGAKQSQAAPARNNGFFVEIDTGKVVEMGQEAFDAEKRHYSLRVDLSMQELAPNRILVSRKGVRSCGTTTQMPRSP